MDKKTYALRGIIVHTPDFNTIEYHENEYVVCEDGVSKGIFKELPEEYREIPVIDYKDKFIIPGMCDMHVHAPQYGFRGIGMLLDCNSEWETWFDKYSFPEESRYADIAYAKKAYTRFVDDMLTKTTTTRASVFATIHRPATEFLMRKMADAGMAAYVGKLNMDRNSRFGLQETTEETLEETERWLQETMEGYGSVKPILTPRYTPTCTDECMEGLGKLAVKYNVPIQSHLSEGLDEIEWVKELKPEISCYGDAYDMYGLLGSTVPSLMAHVVHPTDVEFELLTKRNVMVAHCPQSNMNAAGGVAPIMKMVDAGIKVGLGTDMAGGCNLSILRTMTDAIQASKLRWVYTERNGEPFAKKHFLTVANAFYLATKGGGAFFGKVGSFEPDYEFDAVVLDDGPLADFVERDLKDRMQRILWRHNERTVCAKYIQGRAVYVQEAMSFS
ncbi:amidohydrolase family protein [Ruminococcus sp. RTP21358st1_A5_RTP21358_211008]|uniref:amidohydrolase family protein n=1 Tax=unclassified Ruminococcus TaxID=2608920 RepID=UPI0034A1F12D